MGTTILENRRILVRATTALLAVVALFLWLGSPAYAIGPTPEKTWNTNGTVFSTALSPDGKTLYIGRPVHRRAREPRGSAGQLRERKEPRRHRRGHGERDQGVEAAGNRRRWYHDRGRSFAKGRQRQGLLRWHLYIRQRHAQVEPGRRRR